jgi:hypothetical protein
MEGKGDDADEAAAAAALVARFEAAATEATAIEALAQIAAHAEEMGANHFLGGPMAREAVNALAKEMKEKIAKEWTPAVAKALGAVLKALATMCDVCDKRPATHFCQDCDEYLCIPCNEMHGEHRKKKGHAVRALADMRAADLPAPPEATCEVHPGGILSVWCDTHTQLLCANCVALDKTHRACEYDAVATMAEKHRPEAAACMAQAKDQIAALVAAKEEVKEGKTTDASPAHA